MAGFRGPANTYAGIAGADLANAPAGPVPFTSPFGLPVGRPQTWRMAGTEPGAGTQGVPGQPVQGASGNPDVVTAQSPYPIKSPYGGGQGGATFTRMGASGIARDAEVKGPNIGMAPVPSEVTGPAFIPQFGSPRPLQQGQETAVRAPGNAPVGYSNDLLTTTDRHGIFKVGYENSGRNSGNTDPPLDGPARPSLWLVQRSLSYQQGTDTTAATDDLARNYTRNDDGMYVGSQGDGWSRVYGGVPGLWQEYGSYSGISPSSPPQGQTLTPGIHSPTGQGMPGDGPHTVWAGPPHGLHSPTLPTYSQTLGRYMDITPMARPRIDRPSQSPIAGQSYSQTVQSQGQTGSNKVTSPTITNAPYNTRMANNGWRGRAG